MKGIARMVEADKGRQQRRVSKEARWCHRAARRVAERVYWPVCQICMDHADQVTNPREE